jgi:uncharacterized protein YpmB
MQTIAILLAIIIPILVAMFLPFLFTGERFEAAEEKAHARRLTDARMNARLLRFYL